MKIHPASLKLVFTNSNLVIFQPFLLGGVIYLGEKGDVQKFGPTQADGSSRCVSCYLQCKQMAGNFYLKQFDKKKLLFYSSIVSLAMNSGLYPEQNILLFMLI